MATTIDALIKPQKRNHVRTGDIVEKIAATAKFNLELAQQLSTTQRSRIQKYGLTMLAAYFESYVDNVSRGNSYKYHHIYEFNEVGDKNSRLFVGTINGNNPVLSYSFKQASKPSNSGYVFKNKAFVMENGIPLRIRATDSPRLVFEYKGDMYSKTQVFVPNPGGTEVEGSFSELFYRFMTTQADTALKELGFFEAIEKGIISETKNMLSSLKSSNLNTMSSRAAASANKIARKVSI